MSAAARAPESRPMPAWMSMPGAPTRPNNAEFHSKITQLSDEKKKCFEEIKALQSSLGNNDERAAIDEERKQVRGKLDELDRERKAEKDIRSNINTEMAKIRAQRRDATEKLRALEAELGGLTDAKEIDAAIRYLMKKMETSGGGLNSEKKTMQRVNQLEEAKSLLLMMQPLSEAISETVERENLLHLEYRENLERINSLNKDYDDQRGNKRAKDQEARLSGAGRAEVYKKCDEIRGRLTILNGQMDTLRAEHTKAMAEFDAWANEAREKYNAKIEAERAERQRAYLARQNASKNEEKMARARKRQNPYEMEISACDALTLYLRDKKHMMQQDEEMRRRKEAAAAFDASSVAPAGCVVLNEPKWNNAKPLSKAAKKQQQQQQQKKQQAPAAATTANNNKTERALQHPEDKMRLFQMIAQDPPLSIAAIDDAVKAVAEKKKEYLSHMSTGDLVLSSEDEAESEAEAEEEGEEEKQPEPQTTTTTTTDSAEEQEKEAEEEEAQPAVEEKIEEEEEQPVEATPIAAE